MRRSVILLLSLLSLSTISAQSRFDKINREPSIYTQTPYNSDSYTAVEEFSDEFNGAQINFDKWSVPEDIFAAWTFSKENVNLDGEGNLRITARYDKHRANDRDFYFTSGMLRSRSTKKYGYYETRVKGADLWPSVCSAFWLYTKVPIDDVKSPKVDVVSYNEIDVMELQQIAEDKRMMACNLHIMVLKESADGELTNDFVTAGKLPNMGQNQFPVDWDPESDYHTYACENRPDSIVFYIDNKRVASKPNCFWHMDEGMYVTLSLGMRTPYETYEGGRQPVKTTERKALKAGFPTDMIIDYVRVYERDYSSFENNKRPFNRADFD